MRLRLYNTLTRQLEEVIPYDEKTNTVKMYNCGPTVYKRQHIGNYRAFSEWDILHRVLIYLGYKVERIINMTDVGHMTEDDDFGEDKMEKTAKATGKDPYTIADEVIVTFLEDLKTLNILHPDGTKITEDNIDPKKVKEHRWTRATEYISEMIETIKRIEKGGFTYMTDQALYFDVTKYPGYTELSRQNLSEKETGARDDVNVDPNKKNPADFVLWMRLVGKYKNHIMKWDSPWGVGFPGWHIECTAMGSTELGEHIDIHTGGMEHIGVHHSNERAQNYGAFGHDVVKMWVHNAWLVGKKGEKMSKSKGNVYSILDLLEMGYTGLDIRYYYLSVKYRKPLYFSIGGLESSRSSRLSLVDKVSEIIAGLDNSGSKQSKGEIIKEYDDRFIESISNDLNIPEAFAVMNDMLSSDNSSADKIATLRSFDKVFGLDLIEEANKRKSQNTDIDESELPEAIKKLVEDRKRSREEKNFTESDRLRDELTKMGYLVVDTEDGQKVTKIS